MIPKIEAGSTRQTTGQKVVPLKPKEAVLPHGKMSLDDINWLRSQPESVKQLYLDCLAVEQFGKQLRKLETNLSKRLFRSAKAVIEKQGLFHFEPITELSPAGRLKITGWKVENLHGYYYKSYWEVSPDKQDDSCDEIVPIKCLSPTHQVSVSDPSSANIRHTSRLEPLPHKGLNFFNQCSTNPQLPTKVVEGRVSTSLEKTEAPFGGVLPKEGEVPEEESPMATDETAIASDAVEEVSTEFSTSPQNQAGGAGGEPNDSLEDNCSAAALKGLKTLLGISSRGDSTPMSFDEKAAYAAQQRQIAYLWKEQELDRFLLDDDPWLQKSIVGQT